MRDLLRALPVLTGRPPAFDPAAAPADPLDAVRDWLLEAVDAGVAEPHAVTVSTVGADGLPDARVQILKDVADGALWFSGAADGPRGRQLVHVPAAALTVYWPAVGRQVRARGDVVRAPADACDADFAARGATARAVARTGCQSRPLGSRDELTERVTVLLADPDAPYPGWALWGLVPRTVELWQADPGRQHVRLQYRRTADGWERGLLWP